MLASVAATGIILCIAATGLYGPGIWMLWLHSLPGFLQANDAQLSGRYLALEGPWKAVPIILGAMLAWWSGRKGRYETGVFVATAAALLGSVHAIDYDAAILAPFALLRSAVRRVAGPGLRGRDALSAQRLAGGRSWRPSLPDRNRLAEGRRPNRLQAAATSTSPCVGAVLTGQ
jgi:hypothetical protein